MKSDKKWRISMKDTTIASNFNIKYYLNHEKFITDFSQEDILILIFYYEKILQQY